MTSRKTECDVFEEVSRPEADISFSAHLFVQLDALSLDIAQPFDNKEY